MSNIKKQKQKKPTKKTPRNWCHIIESDCVRKRESLHLVLLHNNSHVLKSALLTLHDSSLWKGRENIRWPPIRKFKRGPAGTVYQEFTETADGVPLHIKMAAELFPAGGDTAGLASRGLPPTQWEPSATTGCCPASAPAVRCRLWLALAGETKTGWMTSFMLLKCFSNRSWKHVCRENRNS